jgi:DNA-binding NtrC family response regulator
MLDAVQQLLADPFDEAVSWTPNFLASRPTRRRDCASSIARHGFWTVSAGVFVLPRLEATGPGPSSAPEIPEPPPLPGTEESAPNSYQAACEEYERRCAKAALERAGGNLSEACRLLGISRNTLKARMRLYGL